MREPSAYALQLLAGMRKAATAEVRANLAAGICVHGIENGKRVVLHAKNCTCKAG